MENERNCGHASDNKEGDPSQGPAYVINSLCRKARMTQGRWLKLILPAGLIRVCAVVAPGPRDPYTLRTWTDAQILRVAEVSDHSPDSALLGPSTSTDLKMAKNSHKGYYPSREFLER